jgi:hypothetical protein
MLILRKMEEITMKNTFNADQLIESLVDVHCGSAATPRDKHLYRETLRSLARGAVAEQALNRQKDLGKTIGIVEACEHA